MIETRGERNNNPGNLRESPGDHTQWAGERTTDDDKQFEEFKTTHDGIRALAKVLLSYYRKHGLNTVRSVIDRWAPPSENNTGAYVNYVASQIGVGIDVPLNLADPVMLEMFVRAIIKYENGRCVYDDITLINGVDAALEYA